MSLVNELIKGLLPEEEKKKVVAVYGGGFKPPTSGHFKVVKQALEENPEIDEFIIFIGGKERNGISPDESILIWDIYKQYLPFKVEVKYTSVPPIKSVYNYAKEHPDEEVLFIIGAREGNDDDFKDIASRTTTLNKYPNLNLRTIVTQGGVSGTAARNASKISLDKFKPFVPSELSDEEVEQVYNIVADKITEGRKKKKDPKKGTGKKPKKSGRRLYTDEDPKDTIGIKFSTRQDIVDTLNKKSFKAKSHARQSQIINLIHQRVRAAYGRSKKADVKKRLKTGLDYITKKKEASKKKTQRLKKLNEEASYSKSIDYKKLIQDFTQHMIDKGMNIEPLPKVEFEHDDTENAKNFFGKTAYYDPNTQTIVLYTEGRHPKDILRSYSHEMVHHTQYLEDRLGDIAGTDTTSDDHLDTIEKEANLIGTMTFRNWTDSILNEAVVEDKIECDNCDWSWDIVSGGNDLFVCHKCGHDNEPIEENKDPFGINAYARELGQLNEKVMDYKVYVDMDGVVADFDQRFLDLSGMMPREFESKYGKNAFWDFIDEGDNKLKFWVGIPQMSDAQQLIDFVSKYDYEMLTAPSLKKQSLMGKGLWMINQTKKGLFPSKPKVNYKSAKNKKDFAAPNNILIDDKPSTIDSWNAAGGIGILHTSAANTISQLKKLGL
jgi:hypothetical protein